MSLIEKLQGEIKQAMKSRDAERLSTLRLTLSDLKKVELDQADGLTEADEIAVVQRCIKQRHEAAEAFDKGDRPEQAAKERAEAELLAKYLPAQLEDADLEAAVAELVNETGASSPRDIGKLMGPLMKKFAGQLDGNRARQAVQKALADGD